MKTITATTSAWLTKYEGPDDLTQGADHAIRSLAYSSQDMSSQGWTLAGTATITVELVDGQTLVDNKVEVLRKELVQERVKADMIAADINLKIQKLLAIEYTPNDEAPAEPDFADDETSFG